MRVLVAGAARFGDADRLYSVLDELHTNRTIVSLTYGDSAFLEKLLESWARRNDVLVSCWYGDWQALGPQAGPERNTRMLEDGEFDLLISLPGGGDLTGKAIDKGIPALVLDG